MKDQKHGNMILHGWVQDFSHYNCYSIFLLFGRLDLVAKRWDIGSWTNAVMKACFCWVAHLSTWIFLLLMKILVNLWSYCHHSSTIYSSIYYLIYSILLKIHCSCQSLVWWTTINICFYLRQLHWWYSIHQVYLCTSALLVVESVAIFICLNLQRMPDCYFRFHCCFDIWTMKVLIHSTNY